MADRTLATTTATGKVFGISAPGMIASLSTTLSERAWTRRFLLAAADMICGPAVAAAGPPPASPRATAASLIYKSKAIKNDLTPSPNKSTASGGSSGRAVPSELHAAIALIKTDVEPYVFPDTGQVYSGFGRPARADGAASASPSRRSSARRCRRATLSPSNTLATSQYGDRLHLKAVMSFLN
jgi:hypothetical protein